METRDQQPKGDGFGTLGEKVVPLRLKNRPPLTLRRRQLALLVICLGALLVILDASVTTVALPLIARDLGFSSASIAWVMSAQLIPFGGFLLMGGRLGEVVGARRVFAVGVGLYSLSLVACGLAPNAAVLIAARAVQGLGGALFTGVTFKVLVSMFPRPREQVTSFGLFGLVAAFGPLIGLFTSAATIDAIGWQWAYLTIAPIGGITVLWSRRFLPDDDLDPARTTTIDVAGPILVISAMAIMVQAVVSGAEAGWERLVLTMTAGLGLLAYSMVRLVRSNAPMAAKIAAGDRNPLWSNAVLGMMSIAPTSTLFIGSLYAHDVLGYDPMQFCWAFVPFGIVGALVTSKVTPRALEHAAPRTVMVAGSAIMAAGLALLARTPADPVYVVDLLPAIVIIGCGTGLGLPAALTAMLIGAHSSERELRSNWANVSGKLGAGLGVAVLTAVAASRGGTTTSGATLASSSGHGLSFFVAASILLVAIGMTVWLMQPDVDKTAHAKLDPLPAGRPPVKTSLRGALDPDFLALGLGGTNMMAMLWSIAVGRRAVGVELRGSPTEAVMHWQIREDLYHHLVLIDGMMRERYGEDRIPKLGNGQPFLLSECFFSSDPESAGDARTDEVLSGFVVDSHIAGPVEAVELVDDRWQDGVPVRTITTLGPVSRPGASDASRVGRPMSAVICERSAFQVGAQELLNLLRRYLTEIERVDLEAGVEPRCRVLTYHRVLQPDRGRRGKDKLADRGGFVDAPDGRKRVLIEAVHEMEGKRDFTRIRRPGTDVIDLGIPELFMIAEGVDSEDAARLGFKTTPLTVDRNDGLGPVIAQADYIFGLMTLYVGSRARTRLSSEFDSDGDEYHVTHTVIGHEEDGEIGWFVLEVPDFLTFDPRVVGLVPPETERETGEFFAGYQYLVRTYFLEKAALITGVPLSDISRVSIARQPTLFTVTAQVGDDPLVAANGVVAGDSFGNGDPLSGGGVNTGMIGHATRVLQYWQARDAGIDHETAVRRLADGIKIDTQEWLALSLSEFQKAKARPVGAAQPASAARRKQKEELLADARRRRRTAAPVNHRDDWSRIHVFVGRISIVGPLDERHPDAELAAQRAMPLDPAEARSVHHRLSRTGRARKARAVS